MVGEGTGEGIQATNMRFDPEGDVNFQLDKILNQGIEFQDNIRGALLVVNLA